MKRNDNETLVHDQLGENAVAKIRNEISIDRPAEDVWAIVRKFGENRDWSEMLSDSKLDGDIRICTLGENSPAPGAVLKERLLSLSDKLMRLEYSVTERSEEHTSELQSH